MYFSTRVRRRVPSRGGYSTPKREEKGYNSYFGIGADLIKYYGYSDSIYGRNPEDFYSIEYDVKTFL